jgi:hypothetical protein
VYVTHGEPLSSDVLRHEIQERLSFRVSVPEYRDEVILG